MSVADWVGSVFIIAGILVAAVASVGLVRFPDVLSRMHAASKPQTFGLILLLVGVAIVVGDWAIAGMLALVGGAQLLTITAASAMLGRAAFRRGFVHGGQYAIDELTPRLAVGQSGDDDDDGFIDEDPMEPRPEGVDISEALPSNTLTETTGLELATLKEFWNAEADDDTEVHDNQKPRTGEFSVVDPGEYPKH